MDLKNVSKKFVGNDEERAVSPVIGVILMVAITVILAAVIAAFVLDLGDTSEPVQAGITSDTDGEETTVTINTADNLDGIQISGDCSNSDFDGITDTDDEFEDDISVGDSFTSDDTDCGEGDNLIIVGQADGDKEIIYDTTI